MWTYHELTALLERIELKDRPEYAYEICSYRLYPHMKNSPHELRFTLRICKWRKDRDTGDMGWGYGGEYLISPECSPSAIILKALKAMIDYEEHECREDFFFDGAQVLGPHPDLLHSEVSQLQVREHHLWELLQKTRGEADEMSAEIARLQGMIDATA